MANLTDYSTIVSVTSSGTNFTTSAADSKNAISTENNLNVTTRAPNDGTIGDHTIPQVVVIAVVAFFLMASTVLGNFLVIAAYRKNRRLRTINNMFLVSLAISDLIIGIVSMTLYPIYMITREWLLGEVVCDIWLCIDYTLSMASVANLLLICLDRYFSVTRPFTYRARRTRRKTKMFILAAWVFSFLLWSPVIVIWPIVKGRSVKDGQCYIQFLNESKTLTIVTAIIAFFFPVTVMCVLYGFIFRETRKCSQYLEYLKSYSKPRVSSPFLNLRRPFHRASTPSNSPYIGTNSARSENRRRFLSLDQGGHGQSGGRVRVSSLSARNFQSDQSIQEGANHRARASSSASRLSASPLIRNGGASPIKPPSPCGSEEVFISSHMAKKASPQSSSPSFWMRIKLRLSIGPRNRSSRKEKKSDSSEKTASSSIKTEPGANNNRQNEGLDSRGTKSTHRGVPAMTVSPASDIINEKYKCRASQNKRLSDSQNTIKMPSSEKKAGRTLSAILLAFFITWLPYNICAVYKSFCVDHDCVPQYVWDFAYYLCYINSTLNPFCFALCNKTFRKAFKQILTCRNKRNINFDTPQVSRKKKKGSFPLVPAASSSSSRGS